MTSSNIVRLEWVIAWKRGRDRCALVLTFSITDLSKCIHVNHCTINVPPVRNASELSLFKGARTQQTSSQHMCALSLSHTAGGVRVYSAISRKKGDFHRHQTANCKIDMHKSFRSGMWKMLQHLNNRDQRGNCETPENNSSVSQPGSYDTKLSCTTVLMMMMMMMMMMMTCSSVMSLSTQSFFSGAC